MLGVLLQVLQGEHFVFEVRDNASLDGIGVGWICGQLDAAFHHFQPFQNKIGKEYGSFICTRVDMSHRVFLQPCQLNGVLKCCHDYLVVLQQFLRRSLMFLSFIAIKCLQISSRHFEQTNRMFLKEWLNLTSNIVGIFRVCTWAKGKSVFFQPLIQKNMKRHICVFQQIFWIKFFSGFEQHGFRPLLITLYSKSCADRFAFSLTVSTFPA